MDGKKSAAPLPLSCTLRFAHKQYFVRRDKSCLVHVTCHVFDDGLVFFSIHTGYKLPVAAGPLDVTNLNV